MIRSPARASLAQAEADTSTARAVKVARRMRRTRPASLDGSEMSRVAHTLTVLIVVVADTRHRTVAPWRPRTFANGMRWKLSLARQFLVLQVGIVLLVVFAVGAVSLAESDLSFRSEQASRLRSVAENL